MIKCDKCGKIISETARQERFIDGHGRVDLCIDCENKLTKLLDNVETEWFESQEVPYCWHCGAKMKGGA